MLHDVGHCPFSHTFEDILAKVGTDFGHERLGAKLITSPDSGIGRVLSEVDDAFPQEVAAYVDRSRRTRDHWTYKLVASQLDADRLDYLLRDKQAAGLKGHGFDLPRLIDMMLHVGEERLAVDRRGIAQVEAYLVMLDHMYRMVYFHHTTRAADVLLGAAFARAVELHRAGDRVIFPRWPDGSVHPLQALVEQGESIEEAQFGRLGDHLGWTLLDGWRSHPDRVLADLSDRLFTRRLFKTHELGSSSFEDLERLRDRAEELTISELPYVDHSTVGYYVAIDGPTRTSYQRYDWRTDAHDEAIWMVGGGAPTRPMGEDEGSSIVAALKETKHFHRLVFPEAIRPALLEGLAAPPPEEQ